MRAIRDPRKFTWTPGDIRWRATETRAGWSPADHPRGPDGKFIDLGDLSVDQLIKLRVEQKKLLSSPDVPIDQVWSEIDRIDAAYDEAVSGKKKPVLKSKSKTKGKKFKAASTVEDEIGDELVLAEPVDVEPTPPVASPRSDYGRRTAERIGSASGAKESTGLPEHDERDRIDKLESNYAWWEDLPPDKQDAVRDLVTDTSRKPTYVRMFSGGLSGMVRDGRMKTVHEVGGKYEGYTGERAAYEREVMGLPGDTPAGDLPVYGYVGDIETADAYGPIAVKLKPGTRERTTATVGDSLNGLVQPYGIDQLPDLDDDQLMSNIYGSVNTHNYLAQGSMFDYVEAQIHGGVTLDDIESITVEIDKPSGERLEDMVSPEDLATLRDHGIEIVVPEPEPLLTPAQMAALGIKP